MPLGEFYIVVTTSFYTSPYHFYMLNYFCIKISYHGHQNVQLTQFKS